MICPSSEDFVSYNGLRPARSSWIAPRRRTLSRTTDFDQLGQHDLPLIGGLCLVQRTSTSKVTLIEQTDRASTKQQWRHRNGAKDEAETQRPTTESSPKISSIQRVIWKWSNLPERDWRILGGRFSLSTLRRWWVLLLRMLNRKTMLRFQRSEDLWGKTQDVDLCVWIFASHTERDRGAGFWIWRPPK